ncbi:MAG TPA: hypothetical protein VFN30_14475 [Chitinophagaceae bacterium]|nr:hypothetical protein [Chitinophagaceae bacterium]
MKYAVSFLIILLLISGSCKRNCDNPCGGKVQPKAEFRIMETLSDTAFEADTIFRDNYVRFKALIQYDSVLWKLGYDPRNFIQQDFSLSFYTALGTVPITFKGYKQPTTNCFPADTGVYMATRNITLVEQVQKPILTLSPLIGRYQGSFTNNPTDTFTVRIEYFDSTKYDVMLTGNKNFYWVSNFPKGFVGTTTAAVVYPELNQGCDIEMGYKCFQFGNGTELNGWSRGWLKNDTLTILNSGNTIPPRKFIGKRL